MFTVKQIVKHATSLYEVPHITVAREGSDQWSQALEAAKAYSKGTPDIIEVHHPQYADEAMKETVDPGSVNIVEREGVQLSDLIAVICSDIPSPVFPEVLEAGGAGYQFIYKGDQVYITNGVGATVETVK